MSTTRPITLGVSCATYRGDKQDEQGQQLNKRYEDKVDRCISQNRFQEARYTRISARPYSLGSDKDDQERKDICGRTMWRSGEYETRQNSQSETLEVEDAPNESVVAALMYAPSLHRW